MRKIVGICGILAALLAFAGCEAQHTGNTRDIRITLDGSRTFNARNIDPDGVAPLTLTSYALSGNGPEGFSFGPLNASSSTFTVHAVPVGQWEFQAVGYNGATRAIAAGTLQAQITHNVDALTIELDELIGSGDLAVTVNWNEEQTYSDVDLAMTVKDSAGTVVATLSETKTTDDSQVIFSKTGLPAGFYTLEISLMSQTEPLAALVETALVIDGTTSSATVDLVIGLVADNNGFTIIDKTAKPLEGSISADVANPSLGSTVTLTYDPVLPDGVDIGQVAIQWYCDGTVMPMATAPTYVITSAEGGTHRYDVVASIPALGSVGSAYTLVEVPVTVWIE